MISQGAGVPNTDLSTSVVPSTRPRLSIRSAKWKGKKVARGGGQQERAQKKDLTPGIDWPIICYTFCVEMAKIFTTNLPGRLFTPRRLTPEPLNLSKKISTS